MLSVQCVETPSFIATQILTQELPSGERSFVSLINTCYKFRQCRPALCYKVRGLKLHNVCIFFLIYKVSPNLWAVYIYIYIYIYYVAGLVIRCTTWHGLHNRNM